MDPNKLAAALMQRDPSITPDLAMRIATNLSTPGGAREQYEQMYPGLFAEPAPTPAPGSATGLERAETLKTISDAARVLPIDSRFAFQDGLYKGSQDQRKLEQRADMSNQPRQRLEFERDQERVAERVFGPMTGGALSYSQGVNQGVLPKKQATQFDDAQRQRVTRYHELMAKHHSGKQLTEQEQQWLNQVAQTAQRGMK